jgi:hypothetical protein
LALSFLELDSSPVLLPFTTDCADIPDPPRFICGYNAHLSQSGISEESVVKKRNQEYVVIPYFTRDFPDSPDPPGFACGDQFKPRQFFRSPLAVCLSPFFFARRNGDHGDNPHVVGESPPPMATAINGNATTAILPFAFRR